MSFFCTFVHKTQARVKKQEIAEKTEIKNQY